MEDASGFNTAQRINQGLFIFAKVYRPFVEAKMQSVFGPRWIERASRARGSDRENLLDNYALLKTTIDRWNEVFRDFLEPSIRSRVSLLLEARNRIAHDESIDDADAITYLRAMTSVMAAMGATESLPDLEALITKQLEGMRLGPSMDKPSPPPGPQPPPNGDMKRAEAIRRVNQRCKVAVLDSNNTRFANINKTQPVWWLEIPLQMVAGPGAKEFVNLLLADRHSRKLYHLRVQSSYLSENIANPEPLNLRVRHDVEKIALQLSTDASNLFQDTHSDCRFRQFMCRCSE